MVYVVTVLYVKASFLWHILKTLSNESAFVIVE